MKKLKVVITAGGTREYVDSVRVFTNISSGRLGAKIADVFSLHGHDVTYVSPKNAVMPSDISWFDRVTVKDTNSLMEAMEKLVPAADVVIQSMAVSDFTFDLEGAVKIGSDSAEDFIEHMRRTIKKTPKVISNFRKWNPDAILVGFKFTVGKSNKELLEIATNLMDKNKLDMVLANDKSQMERKGEHVGMLIKRDFTGKVDKVRAFGKEKIAEVIYDNVTSEIIFKEKAKKNG